jgi:general secretion pathway protein D
MTTQSTETGESVEQSGAASKAPAPTAGEGIEFVSGKPIRIIADQEHNALMILATPREYEMIKATLRKLDIVPLQVLIQASLFEVTLTDDLRYGVRWFLESGNSTLALNNLAAVTGGFSYAFSSSNFEAAIEALASVTDLRMISSPELMVLDNQTATMQIGDQVPVATRSSISVTDSEAPIVNDIQYRDTGVILSQSQRWRPRNHGCRARSQ